MQKYIYQREHFFLKNISYLCPSLLWFGKAIQNSYIWKKKHMTKIDIHIVLDLDRRLVKDYETYLQTLYSTILTLALVRFDSQKWSF